MALIKCPECGKEISDKAEVCPSCGYPVDEDEGEEEKRDLSYEILCLVISIFATFLTFIMINVRIGLLFPLVLYIISAVLGIKGKGKISLIGLLLSGFGVFLILFA